MNVVVMHQICFDWSFFKEPHLDNFETARLGAYLLTHTVKNKLFAPSCTEIFKGKSEIQQRPEGPCLRTHYLEDVELKYEALEEITRVTKIGLRGEQGSNNF